MNASFKKYELHFKQPATTSRETLKNRTVWYLFLEENGITGIGECAPLPGLSIETTEEVESRIKELCANPQRFIADIDLLQNIPSLKFALETALLDLKNGGKQILFTSAFTNGEAGIPINGLIWMGEIETMQKRIEEKLEAGFRCIKLKIGAKNFEDEVSLLKSIRNQFSANQITLRVDANGSFLSHKAHQKLEQLAALDIHSIEQPIKAGQWDEMAALCKQTKLPIALDEELIGINTKENKIALLDKIKPQFLVLKPSLHGGISGCNEWIELAEKRSIGWWVTSYLESDIGLNAIAQWTFTKNTTIHQGLGTGQLFTNNIASPLEIRGEKLWFNSHKNFNQIPR
jgi:o-succinylbenzoate synthase